MILQCLLMLLTIITPAYTQTTGIDVNSITSIDNKHDLTFIIKSHLSYTCAKSMPQRCYGTFENSLELAPGITQIPKSMLNNSAFIIEPKMPLNFSDGRSIKVSPDFIIERTFICVIENNKLYYYTGEIPNNTLTYTSIDDHMEKALNYTDENTLSLDAYIKTNPKTKKFDLTGNRLVINNTNTGASLSFE